MHNFNYSCNYKLLLKHEKKLLVVVAKLLKEEVRERAQIHPKSISCHKKVSWPCISS